MKNTDLHIQFYSTFEMLESIPKDISFRKSV